MSLNLIADQIKKHEGYRGEVYKDSLVFLTCGWGHALHEGTKVPVYVAEAFFWIDFKEAYDGYVSLNLDLDSVRMGVVINMVFNLGIVRFLKFKKMIAALRVHDYEKAAEEMLNSLWASQVKTRAVELYEMMIHGEGYS